MALADVLAALAPMLEELAIKELPDVIKLVADHMAGRASALEDASAAVRAADAAADAALKARFGGG